MKTKLSLLLVPLLVAACGPTMNGTGMTTMGAEALRAVPAGSTVLVALDQPVGANTTALTLGTFTATVVEPVRSATGQIVVPVGTKVEGTVTGYRAGRQWEPHLIGLRIGGVEGGHVHNTMQNRIRAVDLAIADDDSPSAIAGTALWGTRAADVPGTVIEDPIIALQEDEFGPDPGTVVSLGYGGNEILPAGARLTIEVGADLPLVTERHR
jgi:hypothetical protein